METTKRRKGRPTIGDRPLSVSEMNRRSRQARSAAGIPRSDALKQMVGQAFMKAVAAGSSDVIAATIDALKAIAVSKGFDPDRVISMTLPIEC